MNFPNFLEFTVTRFRSHPYKTGFVALYYEATALRIMQDFAEPVQTVSFTPGGIREVRSLYKVTFLSTHDGAKIITREYHRKAETLTAICMSSNPEHFLRSEER